jgi:hypothetical protein
MATIQGNLEALLAAARQLFPPVRGGQNAEASQDEAGSPFVTRVVTLPSSYNANNPNSVAPSWVYGLCVDACADNQTVYVAFGTASAQNETIALPGQVMTIPRGARRVFLRSNDTINPVTVTWFTDRFADKRYSPKTPITGSITGSVFVNNGVGQPVPVQQQGTATVSVSNTPSVTISGTPSVNVTNQVDIDEITSPLPTALVAQVESNSGEGNLLLESGKIEVFGRKFWGAIVNNQSTAAATYELTEYFSGLVFDTATIAAGDYAIFYYGPGCQAGTWPSKSSGHPINVPPYVQFRKLASGAGVAGQKSVIAYWGRY